jgi:hypothetical protein
MGGLLKKLGRGSLLFKLAKELGIDWKVENEF